MSIDGFVGGPNGELDWMTWDWDDKLKHFTDELHKPVDTILLGRKMTGGFVSHWENIVNTKPDSEEFPFAKIMVDTQKIVFSKTVKSIEGKSIHVENRDLKNSVNELKNKNGKDIIVYGGATFVSSLIKENLIDEFYIYVNPAAIGNGLRIFTGRNNLKLRESKQFGCGIVVLIYEPANDL